jgi:Ca2+-binding EF-hand superfamily protein
MLTKKPSSLPKVVTKHSKEKDENMGMKVEEVFGLLDFDLDGKIAVSELRDAILACGVPIEKEEAAALGDHFT